MGFRIKQVRLEANITQEELARRSGVSRTIIAGLESGTIKNTSTKTLVNIAKALCRPVTDIFFDEVV